ncbi:helix-turn-helix domain-containing protein [Asticcacaulis excentricus]|uniref:Helix-turn-helix domain protein n=1 Tax=Asticcacaulis excentricus (strain ATCC 15261 / DSM 4724 / KCTC 12464 / NCIMB 9791 / VKM B-1370 / CB 48) TaxID=573065 RepID=E8RLW7_ASTEC|nr:helix-turn-helix transcriptional regulator [Asticcacaulis excentricus]ADU13786.1 helix-turn-helix domain protein [Asticcacaulis excentricus CB 48]
MTPSTDIHPLPVQLGHALRALRLSKKLKLEELSRLSGLGIATLSHLENGNRDPKLSTITRVLTALRSDLYELVASVSAHNEKPTPPDASPYDLDL